MRTVSLDESVHEEPLDQVLAKTRTWLEEAVIGLNLCPFAASPYKKGLVRIELCLATEPEAILDRALDVLDELLGTEDLAALETALLVIPHGLESFELYLDVVETLQEMMGQVGANALVQLATFHPDYLFGGEDPEDMSHYTNRAPYPIIHFLLEDSVTEATATHTNPEEIPAQNIERLRTLGSEGVERLWKQWRQ